MSSRNYYEEMMGEEVIPDVRYVLRYLSLSSNIKFKDYDYPIYVIDFYDKYHKQLLKIIFELCIKFDVEDSLVLYEEFYYPYNSKIAKDLKEALFYSFYHD